MQAIRRLDSILNTIFSNKRWEFFIVFGFCLFLSLFVLMNIRILDFSNPTFNNDGDHHKYIFMAENNPFGLYFAPFGWRVGLPLLVKLLPFGVERGFLIVTFLSIVGTGAVLYYICRKFVFDKYVCFTGVLLYYGLGWAVFVNLYDFWLTDGLAIFMLALASYFALSRNNLGFLLTLFLGALVKESTLVAIPLYYMFNSEKIWDKNVLKRLAILSFPSIAALICIRLIIPGYSNDLAYLSTLPADMRLSDYSFISAELPMLDIRVHHFNSLDATLTSIPAYILDPFGVLLFILSVIGTCVRSDIFKKFLPFMVCVSILLLFGGDIGRYLVLIFPAIIVLSCYAMVWLRNNFLIRQYYFVVAALIVLLLHIKWYFSVPFQIEFTFVFLGLLVCVLFDHMILSSDSVLRSLVTKSKTSSK